MYVACQVKLQSQPRPLPGQLPQYAGAIDAVKKVQVPEQFGKEICSFSMSMVGL